MSPRSERRGSDVAGGLAAQRAGPGHRRAGRRGGAVRHLELLGAGEAAHRRTSVRIGVDGYNLALPHGTGVATYGAALVDALRKMGHQVEGVFGLNVGRDPEIREVKFYDLIGRERKEADKPGKLRKAGRVIQPFLGARATEVPITERVERQTFAGRLPVFDRIYSSPDLFDRAHRHFGRFRQFTTLRIDNPPDVMHWTYPVPVKLSGARNLYTLHDLVPLRLPFTTLDSKQYYNDLIRKCISASWRICTVSDSSLSDIVSRYPQVAGKVVNTYQSSPVPAGLLSTSAADDAAVIKGIFGLQHRGYFLFFGAVEPKKNVGRIIEAYLSTTSETPLVIVGGKGWQSESELKLLTGGGYGRVADRVVRLDYLPRELLLRLARGARSVIFPSLYEGFGLPVLEAMQLGTAVITSNTSSLPEVAGAAAILVDPYSVTDIANAMIAVDKDESLRESLEKRGVEQASKFSEGEYRKRLSALYG